MRCDCKRCLRAYEQWTKDKEHVLMVKCPVCRSALAVRIYMTRGDTLGACGWNCHKCGLRWGAVLTGGTLEIVWLDRQARGKGQIDEILLTWALARHSLRRQERDLDSDGWACGQPLAKIGANLLRTTPVFMQSPKRGAGLISNAKNEMTTLS